MQTADLVFRFAGAILIGAFIGFVVAVAIKAVRRRDKVPEWPIVVFALVGVAISFARQSSDGLL